MSEAAGEKTEQPTQKRLEEAINKGQIARSPEVQTVFVMSAALMAMMFSGGEMWRVMTHSFVATLGHLHDTPLNVISMQGYAVTAMTTLTQCLWPILTAVVTAALLAGGIQTRFRVSTDVLGLHWDRLNPAAGFKRVFSARSAVPTGIGILKLSAISGLSYGVIKGVLSDPIFHSSVDVARIAEFMVKSSSQIVVRVVSSLAAIAALDYGYQIWRTSRDMMMTKEELKEESKSTEGNPQMKARQRRKRKAMTKRQMLAEVPKADVVVVNPTHIAVALRYDRKTMKAPRIVAKGTRLNAQQIREIAEAHQVPVVQNIPLARLMFKYGRVGGEIPAELYAAVAEVLAWVYRVNAYRYYREQNA